MNKPPDRSKPHQWIGAGLTDRGRMRRSNQDAFAVLNDHGVWIVADGMGGHAGGDVASQLAVESIIHDFEALPASCNHEHDDITRMLRRSIQAANQVIRSTAMKRLELIGMGTTIVVLHIDGRTASATVAHVGDSRAYVLQKEKLLRWTHDHSLVENSVREGILSPEEALTHPMRHVLTRALGTELEVEPDLASHLLHPDDALLLCTDGLTKMLEDDHIQDILCRHASPEEACRALVNEANRLGGEDNITVVVVRNNLTIR
jgi:protein phosphatase